MSVHACASPSAPFGTPRQSVPAASPQPASMGGTQMEATQNEAPSTGNWFARLWAAYRKRRADSRLRNLAADMDPHILQDVGAPNWLVNETTRERDLARLKHTDYMRW